MQGIGLTNKRQQAGPERPLFMEFTIKCRRLEANHPLNKDLKTMWSRIIGGSTMVNMPGREI